MLKRAILFCLLCSLSLPAVAIGEDDTTTTVTNLPEPNLAYPPADRDWASVTGNKVFYRPKVDLAITLPAAAVTLYGFSVIYSKPEIDSNIVKNLKKENVNGFDRWAIKTNQKAAEQSDILFYGAMPYPLILYFDKAIRNDGARYFGLYAEAMAITGILYTGSNMLFDRYRPETYETSVGVRERMDGGNKNSFFAGHVALVATSTFYTASMYEIYHPDSKLMKWGLYGVAIASTAATAYLRHDAGKHFPSDILVGTLVGVGSGMLVPRLHRARPEKKSSFHFMPSYSPNNGMGFAASYRF